MKPRIAIDSIITEKSLANDFVDATYYEPENSDEEAFAKFFINVEVQGNPSVSRSIRRLIYDTCIAEMYRDISIDAGKAFEKVLKSVNEALHELQKREGEFLSKLNVTLAALAGTTLHVSVCGQAEILLLQENSLLSLSEGLVESNDLEHIFQNIASGDLKLGDILIASSSPLPELVKKALPSWYNRTDLTPLFARLESELKHYSYCILGFLLKPDAPEAAVVDTSEGDTATPSFGKWKHIFAGALKTLKHIFIPPEQGAHTSSGLGVPAPEKSFQENAPLENSEEIDTPKEHHFGEHHVLSGLASDDASDIRNALENVSVHHHHEKQKKWSNTFSLLKRNLVELLKKKKGAPGMYTSGKSVIKSKYFQGNRLMIGLIVVILILVVFSISKKNQENRAVEEIRGKLLAVDDLIERSKTQNALDEKAEARQIVQAVYASLNEIKQTKYLKNEIAEKENEVKALEDQIDEVTRVEPTQYADLASKPTNERAHTLFVLDNAIYAVSDKVLFKTILSEVVIEPFDFLLTEEEVAVKAVPFVDEKSILIITNKNRVIEFANEEFKEAVLLDEAKWANFSAVEAYGRRLYVLDRTTGQVLRYSKQNNGFTAPTTYNPTLDGESINQAKDLTIDGDIYYLFDDGTVKRTRSQAVEDFQYDQFPRELDLTGVTSIQKSGVLKQLFMLDPANKRIIVTGFRGLYAKQYVFDTLPEVKDMWVDEGAKQLYILAGQKIYNIGL